MPKVALSLRERKAQFGRGGCTNDSWSSGNRNKSRLFDLQAESLGFLSPGQRPGILAAVMHPEGVRLRDLSVRPGRSPSGCCSRHVSPRALPWAKESQAFSLKATSTMTFSNSPQVSTNVEDLIREVDLGNTKNGWHTPQGSPLAPREESTVRPRTASPSLAHFFSGIVQRNTVWVRSVSTSSFLSSAQSVILKSWETTRAPGLSPFFNTGCSASFTDG